MQLLTNSFYKVWETGNPYRKHWKSQQQIQPLKDNPISMNLFVPWRKGFETELNIFPGRPEEGRKSSHLHFCFCATVGQRLTSKRNYKNGGRIARWRAKWRGRYRRKHNTVPWSPSVQGNITLKWTNKQDEESWSQAIARRTRIGLEV